jgi:hypothetical protein
MQQLKYVHVMRETRGKYAANDTAGARLIG